MTSSAVRTGVWPWVSLATAALAAIGNVVMLGVDTVYQDLTDVFLPQAVAQDIVNLAVVTPALIVFAVLALRGSLRAYLLWLGVVTFTVYNYVIYVVAIPFGPLFFLWVTVLGLSIYALIGGVASLDLAAVRARVRTGRAVTVAAWALIVVAACFALLWLKEDIAATLRGSTPQSVLDMGVPTNVVHILDLAFFLPAAVAAGVLLLRDRPLGYGIAPGLLVFMIVTGIPILVTPFVAQAQGTEAAWGVLAPIGVLTTALCLILWRFVRAIGPAR